MSGRCAAGWTILVLVLAALPGCGDDDAAQHDAATMDAAARRDARPTLDASPDAGLVLGAYYVAPDGDDGNPGTVDQPWLTIGHAAATLVAGETVYIREGTYGEHVALQNSGSAGSPITFSAYPGETATVDGHGITLPGGWGGLFEISGVDHIQVIGVRVINAGPSDNHAGILVENASNVLVQGCATYNTVSSGIGVWRSNEVTIHGNEVELACNDGSQECITMAITDGFEVSHNRVHHSGPGSSGGEGIDIKDGSSNGVVFGNVVHDTNRLGIYVDAWDKHTFNIEVFGNVVYDTQASGYAVAAEAGGLLENVWIHNNVAYGNHYTGLTVGGWGVAGESHAILNVYIINNTFYGNGTSGWGPGIVVENPEADGVVLRNNLFSQNGYAQLEISEVGLDLAVDHNLFHGDGPTEGTDSVQGDPLLVDPTNGDFRLLAGSPAINQGSNADVPSTDFDGQTRPQGSGYDIGAFEYAE